MSLFQRAVLAKHLKLQDKTIVQKAFKKYSKYFHNSTIQQNIRESKEEQYQAKFLDELFVNVLGYTLNPQPNFNLTTELKNEKNSKKADGAILKDGNALAVIELKGTNTKDLEKVRQQAFDYKANQSGCVYVITSNFEKLRFYINNAVEFEEFNLFNLSEKDFELFYLCLENKNLINNIPLKIKEESIRIEEQITKGFYKDYSDFKRLLFRDLVRLNMKNEAFRSELALDDKERGQKNIKQKLFKKSQKLIDRFLFIFFAEDRGLLPPNSTVKILDNWDKLNDLDASVPLYDRFKLYFNYLDTGRKGTAKKAEIFAYNGGLFKPDPIIDSLHISDDLLYEHTRKLSDYDFESEVDVNILGHIFENSLNEIESVNAEIEGNEFDKQTTKRKKDGVFYTPKYITKYIVDNTVGKLCEKKKAELGIVDEEYTPNRNKATKQRLLESLEEYRKWLLQLTICDPACGSGAFLNQALDFLITEHQKLDVLQTTLLGGGFIFPEIENTVLENNIFGVDINEESVEIAKLSLWLRTAQPRRKLNDLSSNIKCGNSIIDNKTVAGDKAFKWEEEFSFIFDKGGFDVVIGNPPYGAFLDKPSKEFLSKNFDTFQGNFEIYFFFIELLTKLLKKNGEAGYITPDTWINIPQAQKLREHVILEFGIWNIVTFDFNVFEDASVNAIIFILKKGEEIKKCKIIHANDKFSDLSVDLLNAKESLIKNWKTSVDKQFQVWQSDLDISIISKVISESEEGINFLDVCQGIVPYSTEHLTKEQIKERIYHSKEKESEEWGEWVQGRAISRYGVNAQNKEFLKYGDWLHRSRKPKFFNGERILIQEITGGNPPRISAAIFDDVLYHDPGIISCLNVSDVSIKFLLAIINSKLISWYNIKTSPKGKRTTFPKVLIGDIRRLPIKRGIRNDVTFIESKVDVISNSNKNYLSVINKFQNYLLSQFSEIVLTKKLLNWHELEFSDFIKELNKAIKSTNKERAKEELELIPVLSKLDEMDWMEVFETKKAEAQALKAEIDKTDMEIDQMVYELYGLTDEEIAIVEAG
tara:strand:- start:218167 stop:221295 length:3129 start_codon:yes stop_codon:yes gene_type:complete